MGANTTASKPEKHNRRFLHSTFGHIIVGILAAIIVGVSVWGAMTVSANRNIAITREMSKMGVAVTSERLAVASRNAAIREAQAHLYEAAIELERRNFGTANTRLKEAATALAALPSAGGGTGNDARVARLQRAIAALDLTVVTDVSTQRDQVLVLAQQAGESVSAF
jgi:hypothetical protein